MRVQSHFKVAAVLLIATSAVLWAQSPRGKASGKVGTATISIEHGSPLLKGRDIMSLVIPGQLWRLGADDNTIMTTSAPLQFGGKAVAAGRYTLAMRFVTKETWNFLILSKGDAFEFDPSGVVAEVPVKLETVTAPAEQLTISVANGAFQMLWGSRKATVPITAPK